jgi:hypothetical protein
MFLPDVCDKARLLVIEVPIIAKEQLLQIVSPHDAEALPSSAFNHN